MSSETVGLFIEMPPLEEAETVVDVEVTTCDPNFERTDIRDILKMEKDVCITTTALIKSSEVKETKEGKAFVNYVFHDRSGELKAKHWDASTAIEAGQVVKVRGYVNFYRDQVQLKIERLRVFHEGNESVDFVPASKFDPSSLENEFWEVVEALRGDHGHFVRAFLHANWDTTQQMLDAPAALLYHHAFWHGLIEHTISMIGLSRKIVRHYRHVYDDEVDEELVICGVILHDFAKARDQEWDGGKWVETEHARLVGHIPACIAMLQSFYDREYIGNPDFKKVLLDLQHLVASHHGQVEFGAAVVPKTVEAMLLHHVDMIDSKMAMWREATDGLEPGEWSQWSRPLRSEFRK